LEIAGSIELYEYRTYSDTGNTCTSGVRSLKKVGER